MKPNNYYSDHSIFLCDYFDLPYDIYRILVASAVILQDNRYTSSIWTTTGQPLSAP